MLVLMAFGLAVAAYVFDLDDFLEGRKITFFVVGPDLEAIATVCFLTSVGAR